MVEARTATGAAGFAGATTHGKLNRRPAAVEARKKRWKEISQVARQRSRP